MTKLQKIEVEITPGKKPSKQEVHSSIFGELAVHRAYNESGWTITHVATGYSILKRIAYKKQAVALVEIINEFPWERLRGSTHKEIMASRKKFPTIKFYNAVRNAKREGVFSQI